METPKKTGGAWGYIGVGAQMVAATFAGAGIGWWLDRLTGWSPVFLITFFFLGSGAGLVLVYQSFRDDQGAAK